MRATPKIFAAICRFLAASDTVSRQLLIKVRQYAQLHRGRREADVSGSVGNDRVRGSGERTGGNVVVRPGDEPLRADP